jgi:hypothetical protein
MANNNEYPNQVPIAKQERLQPKFATGHRGNSTIGELVVKQERGLGLRATDPGAVMPNQGGRRARIGLPDRFGRGD